MKTDALERKVKLKAHQSCGRPTRWCTQRVRGVNLIIPCEHYHYLICTLISPVTPSLSRTARSINILQLFIDLTILLCFRKTLNTLDTYTYTRFIRINVVLSTVSTK